MRLEDLESGAAPLVWEVDRDPGSVAFDGEPLSVGAKVGADGRIDPNSADQFHGTINHVVVDVG